MATKEVSLQSPEAFTTATLEDDGSLHPLLSSADNKQSASSAVATGVLSLRACVKRLNFSVVFSFFKLLLTVTLSLATTTYWRNCYDAHTTENMRCSAKGLSMECATLQDQCFISYSSPPGASCATRCYFGGYMVAGRSATDDTCYAYIDSECLCNVWLNTRLVVIALSVTHFLVQLCYLYQGFDFDPQALVLDVSLRCWDWRTYQLIFSPANGVLSFIEALTLAIAWWSIAYTPWGTDVPDWLTCDDATVVYIYTFYAMLAYPLLMTFLEISKVYVRAWLTYRSDDPSRGFLTTKLLALSYVFRVDLIFHFLLILVGQSLMVVVSLFYVIVPPFWQDKGYQNLKARWAFCQSHKELLVSNRAHWRLVLVGLALIAFVLLAPVIMTLVVY